MFNQHKVCFVTSAKFDPIKPCSQGASSYNLILSGRFVFFSFTEKILKIRKLEKIAVIP